MIDENFLFIYKTRDKKRFKINVDIFVLRKKCNVHFAFEKILTSYYFFDKLILFAKSEWEKRKFFFDNYEMVNPKSIVSLKWKNDYIFFQKKKK